MVAVRIDLRSADTGPAYGAVEWRPTRRRHVGTDPDPLDREVI